MTTKTNASRLMTSTKPCKLNPNQRAYAVQILEAQIKREDYSTKYCEVQASQNYRVKLAYCRKMPSKQKIAAVLKTLRDAGYVVDAKILECKYAADSLCFMFKGVQADNSIKQMPGYNPDGQLSVAKPKKKPTALPIVKKGKPAKEEPEFPWIERNHKINHGLPKGIFASHIDVLVTVLVQFRDAPATPVLVTEADHPLSRKNRAGELSYSGLDREGNDVRFTSTQVLAILQTADMTGKALQLSAAKVDSIPKRVRQLYAKMVNEEAMVEVRVTRGTHDVIIGDDYETELSNSGYIALRTLPGLVEKTIMSPGCSPTRYLVHESNQHAEQYEVEIYWANRSGTVEL